MKTKLLATSSTLNGITALINKFFYSTTKTVKDDKVLNGDGQPLTNYRVTEKKGKYRFEEII